MSNRLVLIKNTTLNNKTWLGQVVSPSAYFTIPNADLLDWYSDEKVLKDITSGEAVINDGSADLGIVKGMAWLNGNGLTRIDGKLAVHQTSRNQGLVSYFTGCGDSEANEYDVGGGGQMINAQHLATDMMTQYYRVYFNAAENETHIHEGYLQWMDARNDKISLEFIPKVTPYSAGTNTNYTIYGGYLIIPAGGDGLVVVTPGDEVLVEVPLNEDGVQAGAGYWDADWNYTTKVFENIAPNYGGVGKYNMFSLEVVLDRFINKICMLGSGAMQISTTDSSMLGHNMGIKFTIATMGMNHEWWWNSAISFFRRKTK